MSNTDLEAQVRHIAAIRQAETRRQFLVRELAAEQRTLASLQALSGRLGYGTPLQMVKPPPARTASLAGHLAPTQSTYEQHAAAVAQARRNYQAHYAQVHRDFDALVAAKMKAGASRYEALRAIGREQPDLWRDVRNLRPI